MKTVHQTLVDRAVSCSEAAKVNNLGALHPGDTILDPTIGLVQDKDGNIVARLRGQSMSDTQERLTCPHRRDKETLLAASRVNYLRENYRRLADDLEAIATEDWNG
jgi:hypothetical protein